MLHAILRLHLVANLGQERKIARLAMHQVTPEEAVAHLAELIRAAMRGERVVISDDAQHAVLLVPVTPERRQRHAGSAHGLITMSEDFDAPLPDFEAYM